MSGLTLCHLLLLSVCLYTFISFLVVLLKETLCWIPWCSCLLGTCTTAAISSSQGFKIMTMTSTAKKSALKNYTADIYISFSWGRDEENRRNQDRLSVIVQGLRSKGFIVHFGKSSIPFLLCNAYLKCDPDPTLS